MPTYRLTARNQFRSPSGAVGEAPDGPGAMATMLDDVDGRLGVGGAEYCANNAAVLAIPGSRLYVGKLVYRADVDTVYRYVGAGNTTLGGGSWWQGFSKPPTAYSPTFSNLAGSNTVTAFWGITDGITWASIEVISGSGYSLTPSTDVTVTIPTNIIAGLTNGRGTYYRGGLTANGSQWDLVAVVPGPASNGATGSFRIRAIVQNGAAAGAATVQNTLSSVVPSPYNGDRFQIEMRSPSGAVM